jgi:hypothetical protein
MAFSPVAAGAAKAGSPADARELQRLMHMDWNPSMRKASARGPSLDGRSLRTPDGTLALMRGI